MPRLAIAAALALTPQVSFAAVQSLVELSVYIQQAIYRPLVYVLLGLALLLFVWGIVQYMTQSGDAVKAKEASALMSYGVIILFVMVAVWGLVRMGLAFFGFDSAGSRSDSVLGVPTGNP